MLLKITGSFAKEKLPLMIFIELYGGGMRFPGFLQGGLLCELTPEVGRRLGILAYTPIVASGDRDFEIVVSVLRNI